MKKNRILALLLAGVLALGLLAGCGGNNDAPGNNNSNSNTQTQPPSNNDAQAPSASPVELTVVTSYGGDDGNRKN